MDCSQRKPCALREVPRTPHRPENGGAGLAYRASVTTPPRDRLLPSAATVLVADDDASWRHALRRALNDEGYEVVEACDGEVALDLLAAAASGRRDAFDVVVLDVLMPFCSGLGILEVMRKFRNPPPALLMTSFEDRSVDVLARRLGAFCVLHKPAELEQILGEVLSAAKLHRSRR